MDAHREWIALATSAGLCALALTAVGIGLWAWVRLRRRLITDADGLRTILAAPGEARLIGAAGLLLQLARRGDGAALAATWRQIEGPLAAALPGSSPPVRQALGTALAAAAEATPRAELAHSLRAFRRTLLGFTK
jgi:hypothetical protein